MNITANSIIGASFVFFACFLGKIHSKEEWEDMLLSSSNQTKRGVYLPKNEAQNPHTSFSLEFLYFQAVEDSLRYAAIIPQSSIYQPEVTFVDQKFEWSSGTRLSFANSLFFDDWHFLASWMLFRSEPDSVHASNQDFGILAGASIPIIGSNGNSMVDYVKGGWKLRMNMFELGFMKGFCGGKHFKASLLTNLKGGVIRQSAHIHYGDYVIDFTSDNTPHRAIGKSSYWGIGPEAGIDFLFFLPKNFSIFLDGRIAELYGSFSIKTIYKDLLNAPEDAKIVIKEHVCRFLPTGILQIGVSKKFTGKISCEWSVAWESQIWWGQMRMNWFSTIVSPQNGANLTLSGVALKGQVSF